MRVLIWGIAAVLSAWIVATASAQDEGGLARKGKAPVATAPGPLTLGELHASIEKVELALRRVVLSSSKPPLARAASPDRPAKRTEIIAEFARLFQMAKPNFKFTPRAVKYDGKLFTIPANDPARKQVEDLIRYGFVGRVAPIATAPVDHLTLDQFGDALGFFIARLGDVTHTPSTKWSPYLFNHRSG